MTSRGFTSWLKFWVRILLTKWIKFWPRKILCLAHSPTSSPGMRKPKTSLRSLRKAWVHSWARNPPPTVSAKSSPTQLLRSRLSITTILSRAGSSNSSGSENCTSSWRLWLRTSLASQTRRTSCQLPVSRKASITSRESMCLILPKKAKKHCSRHRNSSIHKSMSLRAISPKNWGKN